MEDKKMLIISSHALDFVWRAGGTIVNYSRNGWKVKVICLTYGERGESDEVWASNPGIDEARVKGIRKKESEKAADILGVSSLEFFDWGDHPLIFDRERILKIAHVIKEYNPKIILTQFERDQLNPDHPETTYAVSKAVRCATVSGVYPELPKIPLPAIFMYDPSQPEFFGFTPNTFIDITENFKTKEEAMMITNSQKYLIDGFRARGLYRGSIAKRFSGNKAIRYAEGFVRVYPYVGENFS